MRAVIGKVNTMVGEHNRRANGKVLSPWNASRKGGFATAPRPPRTRRARCKSKRLSSKTTGARTPSAAGAAKTTLECTPTAAGAATTAIECTPSAAGAATTAVECTPSAAGVALTTSRARRPRPRTTIAGDAGAPSLILTEFLGTAASGPTASEPRAADDSDAGAGCERQLAAVFANAAEPSADSACGADALRLTMFY